MNVHDVDHTLVRSHAAPMRVIKPAVSSGAQFPGLPATIWLLPASELGHIRSVGDRERRVCERISLQGGTLP